MIASLLAATLAVGSPVRLLPPSGPPPVGTYVCYYYGYDYALTSSSLTQLRVLPGARIQIVGETVPFRFDADSSRVTLAAGRFRGATAKYQLDGSRKPALVFPRKRNEALGHRIDVSDTWCYLKGR